MMFKFTLTPVVRNNQLNMCANRKATVKEIVWFIVTNAFTLYD